MKIALIDNYDSFTYNLAHLIGDVVGNLPIILKNDECDYSYIKAQKFTHIILSPGPGNPTIRQDFGVCTDIIQNYNGPMMGVCLGHQGLAGIECHDCEVVEGSPEPFHGRVSTIYHEGDSLFQGIPSSFRAMRYHSLVLNETIAAKFHILKDGMDF